MYVKPDGEVVYEVDIVKLTPDFAVLPYCKPRPSDNALIAHEKTVFGVRHGNVNKHGQYSFTEKTQYFKHVDQRVKHARCESSDDLRYFNHTLKELTVELEGQERSNTYYNNMSYRYNSKPRRRIHV